MPGPRLCYAARQRAEPFRPASRPPPLMGRLSRGLRPRKWRPFPTGSQGGVLTPYKCYRLLPGWLFRFLIIPSKYTPYTAIAAALTQADTFNPGVW